MKTNSKIAVLLFAAAGISPGLLAQTQSPQAANPEEEAVVLSPFEVTATKDTGYQATETLAGTRIRTDLRDVGSAISVITKEFLQDIGATDNSTLLQYTPNAEAAGTRGTYAGLGNGPSVDESATLRAPASAQRVRGLDSADNARDFFITDIPWDSYIVDRVDIQRGPNSILFGLGSPAGIVNATTRSAEFRNHGEVQGRTGSYGSVRGSLDLNQELIKNVLAIRVDGLWNHEKFQQKPAFQNDERFFGAIRFDPQLFKDRSFHTSIKAKYEHGDIDANRPRTVTPNDSITPWFRGPVVTADNPFGGMGKLAVDNGYVVGVGEAALSPWLGTNGINQQQPFWTIDGNTGQVYRAMGGYINPGARNNDGTIRGASAGVIGRKYADQFMALNNLTSAANNAGLVNSAFGQYRTQSMTDSSAFNYYDTLIDGPTKGEFEKWDAYNVDISQTAYNDRLGVELTFDQQKYKRGGHALLGGSPTINIDVLKNFADYYVSGANGLTTTNPNFGRPFVTTSSGGSGNSYYSDRKYTRGSIFGELRASDYFDKEGLLAKILGKHRLNGVYSHEKYFTENRSWVENANSQEWAGYWNGTDGSGSSIVDRQPVGIIYLGSSVASRSTVTGANIPGITAPVALANGNVRVFDSTWTNPPVTYGAAWTPTGNLTTIYDPAAPPSGGWTQASNPANYVGWSNFNMKLVSYNNGADLSLLTKAQLSMRETTSYAGSWQAFLWNDAIIPTVGWRYDEVKGKGATAASNPANRSILKLQPDVYKLPDEYPANQIFKDHSTSGGVVVHLNKIFGDHDPLPINVSVSYNKSNNFQVTDTRRDLYGNPIANPTGATKDYGVLLSTKDGKYSFRAIKYESSVSGANSGINNPNGLGGIIQQGLKWRNVFLYDMAAYDWSTRDAPQGRNTWGGSTSQGDPFNGAVQSLTQAQGRALEDAAIKTWNQIQIDLTAKGFFQAWGFTPQAVPAGLDRTTYEANPAANAPSDTTKVYAYVATAPQGFTVTADTASKGYELEFTANPLPNWRIAFNASKTEAVRSNVGGPLIDEYVAYLDAKLAPGQPAGDMPQFGNASLNIYANVWAPWRSNYALMKLQENTAASELRKWRYNIITNYTFRRGILKDVGVGGSYRWQDKVTIGYPVVGTGSTAGFDLTQPYFGPAEDAFDFWASYERKLTEKIRWRIQLNIRNAFAKDGLVPISIEPDGKTWASVRTRPVQEWFVTNSFSF